MPAREEMFMIRQHITIVGCALALLCIVSTLAGAAEMVCVRVQETVQSSPGGGQPVRTDCVTARGADGKEVAVMVPNARAGVKLDCTTSADGKTVCTLK